MSLEHESLRDAGQVASPDSYRVYREVIVDRSGRNVVRALQFVIMFLIILGLTGVVYVLISGNVIDRNAGTYLEAQLNVARAAVDANSFDGHAWSDYITVLTQMRRYGEAERELARGRKVLKDWSLLVTNLAGVDLLGAEGKNKESYALSKKQIEIYEQLEKDGLAAKAEKGAFITSVELAPDVAARTYLTAARAAGRLEKWDEVISLLTRVLVYDPLGADTLTFRGETYLRLGDKEKARADFKQALTYIPDYAPARAGLEKTGE